MLAIMEDKIFESILELKIADVVSIIMERNNLDFEDALQYLYISELYKALITESTKLWHLSAEKLYDMLESEKQTQVLTYPDFV